MTTPSSPEGPTLLAERLLQRPCPERPTSVELIVGGLPAALRATFPLPADGRLIRSAPCTPAARRRGIGWPMRRYHRRSPWRATCPRRGKGVRPRRAVVAPLLARRRASGDDCLPSMCSLVSRPRAGGRSAPTITTATLDHHFVSPAVWRGTGDDQQRKRSDEATRIFSRCSISSSSCSREHARVTTPVMISRSSTSPSGSGSSCMVPPPSLDGSTLPRTCDSGTPRPTALTLTATPALPTSVSTSGRTGRAGGRSWMAGQTDTPNLRRGASMPGGPSRSCRPVVRRASTAPPGTVGRTSSSPSPTRTGGARRPPRCHL